MEKTHREIHIMLVIPTCGFEDVCEPASIATGLAFVPVPILVVLIGVPVPTAWSSWSPFSCSVLMEDVLGLLSSLGLFVSPRCIYRWIP